MPTRLIAFLLALVLLWSGFATQEQAISLASSSCPPNLGQGYAVVSGGAQHAVHDGSVDDHYLDDQPGQVQAEAAVELQALVQTRMDARTPTLAMSGPFCYALADWFDAYLDEPQRPPCATPLVA